MIFNSKENKMVDIKEFYELDCVRVGTVTIGIGLAVEPDLDYLLPFKVYREVENSEKILNHFGDLDLAIKAYEQLVWKSLKEAQLQEGY